MLTVTSYFVSGVRGFGEAFNFWRSWGSCPGCPVVYPALAIETRNELQEVRNMYQRTTPYWEGISLIFVRFKLVDREMLNQSTLCEPLTR
jgi:hypothetical protein